MEYYRLVMGVLRAMKNTKKLDALLIEKSVNIAKRKGDDYNGFLFSQLSGKRLSDGDRRNCNVYLFGSMWDKMTMKDLEALP
jgi:hypothetical protein